MFSVAPSLTLPRIAGEGTEQVKWKSRLGQVEAFSLVPALLLVLHPSPRHSVIHSDLITLFKP
jgi:hypothetical protein